MLATATIYSYPFLLQQVTGSNTSGFGMGTSAMTTQDGSFLVAFVGWDTTNANLSLTEPPNPPPYCPAVNVTDSDGNLWQQIGTTVSQGYSSRCAIWACANASAVTWVSVGLTGFAASLAWTVAEITDMPQDIGLDFSSGDTTAPLSVDSLTLAGEAATETTDIVFTMLALPVTSTQDPTLTSAPPYRALTPVSVGGSGGSGIAIYPYWQYNVPAGITEAEYVTSAAGIMTGVIAGITANAAAPRRKSPTSPSSPSKPRSARPPATSPSPSTTWSITRGSTGRISLSGSSGIRRRHASPAPGAGSMNCPRRRRGNSPPT